MRPLRPGDPVRVGPYRTLARLGAGGMGVVYLARSPGGSAAAVKLIHAARAGDDDFRARFRREVEAARRVDSAWATPLLDADADARDPWLATAFVPGPSLGEAVGLHGPLPRRTVRILGHRLADALDAVHRAGLVHRDVKPGNVLLGLDGPRLIDFGIARSPDGTVLTSSGVVVGSPGFLAPEQAQARRRDIGPPSDVFALGCVLAHAATGVRPFGGGLAAAALLRTVTEEPDLDDVPADLTPLLRACLAKDPADRPDAAAVREELLVDPGDAGPWLPEPVTRLIAERSAQALRILALAAAEDPAPDPRALLAGARTVTATRRVPGDGGHTSRRRLLSLGGAAAAVAAAGAGSLWWALSRPGRTAPAGGASPDRPVLTLAVHGDLSGAHRAVGRAQERGARVAVAHVNSQRSRPFRLALRVYDDGGVPARAAGVAERLVADPAVRAAVGPTTDACALAVVETYHRASLATVAVSPGVDANRKKVVGDIKPRAFILGRPLDELMTAPCLTYLTGAAGARRLILLDDRTQGELGDNICRRLASAVRDKGLHADVRPVPLAMDADATAAAVKAAGADGVLFTGDERRTAALARSLAAARFTGARMGLRQGCGPAFLEDAGSAAEGWVFTTPFVDAERVPAARSFTAAYRELFGTAPPWYAAEAYDAVLFLAEAMTSGGAAVTDRGSLVRRTHDIRYQGITRTLDHSVAHGGLYDVAGLFLHRVTDGTFRFLGQYARAGGV
ncbi:bifunctional serine/threonine-protein kinase/ABC transporter substrate-binding protein [Streptomyces sp. NPDC047821]|uniref:bifunctional serine/threonine-protein kinase/ABC transporter substrate-binding protein n=1 Tax=Streptomyces sp. NPDC047821 TaxID=3365488 RepID=UPI003710B580